MDTAANQRKHTLEREVATRREALAADPLRALRRLDFPPGGSPLLEEGIDAVARGNYDDAEVRFQTLVASSHLQLTALASIGLAHIAAARGRPAEAAEFLGDAMTFGSRATGQLARVKLASQSRDERAFEQLRAACASGNPAVAYEAGIERASLLLQHARFDEAEHVLDRFVRANDPERPGRMRRLIETGRDQERAGDLAAARLSFEEAAHAGDPLGAFYLARLFRRQDRFTAAARAYAQAVDADDGRVAPQAALELGSLFEQRGRYTDAAKCYRQAAESGNPTVASDASARRERLRLSRRIGVGD